MEHTHVDDDFWGGAFQPEIITVEMRLWRQYFAPYDQNQFVLEIKSPNHKKKMGYVQSLEKLDDFSHQVLLWDLVENLQLSVHPKLFDPIQKFAHALQISAIPFDGKKNGPVPILGVSEDELMADYDNKVAFTTNSHTWSVIYREGGRGDHKTFSVDMEKFYDQFGLSIHANSYDYFAQVIMKMKVLNEAQFAHLRNIIKGKEYPPSVQNQENKFSPGGGIPGLNYEPYPGGGNPYVGFQSDGNTISNSQSGGRPAILGKLGGMLKIKVEHPCKHKILPKAALEQIIIHLNDTEKWTREQIADWLDLLHESGTIDLSIESPNEDKA